MAGELGTPSKPLTAHGERLRHTPRTSDPANPSKGDEWLRSDLAPETDQIATFRFHDGTQIHNIPVFVEGTSGPDVEEVKQIEVNGQNGYVPITATNPTLPQRGFQYAGVRYGLHAPVSAPPASAITRYRFDEGAGSTAIDSWGNNDGTINGATYTADAAVGYYALTFSSGDYVEVPHDSSLSIAGSGITITARIRPSSVGDVQVILAKAQSGGGDTGSPDNYFVKLINDELSFVFEDSAENNHQSTSGSLAVQTGVYQFVAVTYDGSNVALRRNSTTETVPETASMATASHPVTIGKYPGVSTQNYVGEIDDLRLYNKALSDSELDAVEAGTA